MGSILVLGALVASAKFADQTDCEKAHEHRRVKAVSGKGLTPGL
jgi:hypothetical protein